MSDFETLLTTQSMELSRPEYWSGQPFSSPGDLPNPGIEPRSPALHVDSSPAEPQEKGTIIHGWSVGFREKFAACKAIRRW